MNRWTHTALALLMVAALAAPAAAHKPSDSYLRITGGGERLAIEWDIAIKDLEFLLGLDADRDGAVTWGELRSRRDAIAAHALSRLQITADHHRCDLSLSDMLVNQHSDGAYAVLILDADATGEVGSLRVDYDLLFDADPTHRGLVLVDHGGVTSTHVLSPAEPSLVVRAGEVNLLASLTQYVREGVWHIWIGYDHILFLLCLLLPAVLTRRPTPSGGVEWGAVDDFRPACRSVLKIVTVFTLAHSITLWLSVMEWVSLPSQWVESAIALSIIVTAVNNLFPVLPLSGWLIAFAFGLVHGFGFANVLVDLGLGSGTLAVALLGFNVGVELGQLAIVLAFFPLAYAMRATASYRWFVLRAGSVAIAMVAAVWVYERVCNVEVLGF